MIAIYSQFFLKKIRFSFQEQSSVAFLVGECSGSKRRVCGIASIRKYDFNKAAMQLCWGHTSAWVFSEFAPYLQGSSLWRHLNLSFAKTLSLIVHFKGTLTYCYHYFDHDSQIFNFLTTFIIISNSSYICVSCVHKLKLFFFLSITE